MNGNHLASTNGIMGNVLVTLAPGIAAMTYVWGMGVVWNVALLAVFCLSLDVGCTGLRTRRFTRDQLDVSALVTAALIGICLPPWTSVWVLVVASLAAIGLAKHAYGGLGRNVFNPAMVGFAVVLVSFPGSLDHWPALAAVDTTRVNVTPDALTGATLLTEFRYRNGLTVSEFADLHANALALQFLIVGAFALGGATLLWRRIIHHRIPLAMAIGIGITAMLGYAGGDSSSSGSAWFHWTAGGFVAAALFVATDPVTHPLKPSHQWCFGLGIGAIAYFIRAFGAYPDGIAFAVLLGNCMTPLLNRWHLQQSTHAAATEHTS